MSVKADLIQESGLRQNEDGTYEQTRVFRVNGLSTSAPSAWHFQALTAAGIPAHKATHPVYGAILVAKTREVRPLEKSATQAKVVVVYRTPTGGEEPPAPGETARLSIGASIESTTTNVDKDGVVLTHEYTQTGEDSTTLWTTAYPTVQVDNVIPFLRYQQSEISTVSAMASKVATYSGALNNSSFLGHPARTWKCAINADYDYTNELGQLVFIVNYELYYKEETWKATTRYDGLDESGKPPSDLATNAQTLKDHNVIREASFGGLGIVGIA